MVYLAVSLFRILKHSRFQCGYPPVQVVPRIAPIRIGHRENKESSLLAEHRTSHRHGTSLKNESVFLASVFLVRSAMCDRKAEHSLIFSQNKLENLHKYSSIIFEIDFPLQAARAAKAFTKLHVELCELAESQLKACTVNQQWQSIASHHRQDIQYRSSGRATRSDRSRCTTAQSTSLGPVHDVDTFYDVPRRSTTKSVKV